MKFPETHRIQGIKGGNGMFAVPINAELCLWIVASKGEGWEHVSGSLKRLRKKKIVGEIHRCPTWDEMCKMKDLFWDEEEAVIQIHPPKSQHVSTHPYVLHLWRPLNSEIPLPDPLMVGIPGTNLQRF